MLRKFILEDLEFPFDDQKLLLHEAIWLEKVTGVTARHIQMSFMQGGAIGIGAWLLLAARRNGHHLKWERIQNIDFGSDELQLEMIDPPTSAFEGEPDNDGDDEGQGAGESPDPSETSSSAPPDPSPTEAPTVKAARRSAKKSSSTSRTS